MELNIKEILKNHIGHVIYIEAKIAYRPVHRILNIKCDSCKEKLFSLISSDAEYSNYVHHLRDAGHRVRIVADKETDVIGIVCDSCNEETIYTSERPEESKMNIHEAIHLDNRKANVINILFDRTIANLKNLIHLVKHNPKELSLAINMFSSTIVTLASIKKDLLASASKLNTTKQFIDFVLMEDDATKNARILNSIKRVIWGHEINKPCNCNDCKSKTTKTSNSEIPKTENPEITKPQNPKFQILKTYILQNPKTINRMKLYFNTRALLNAIQANPNLQTTHNTESFLHDYYMTSAIKPDHTIDYSHANYHTLETLIKDNITSIDENYDQNYSMIIAHDEQSIFKTLSII